MLAAIYRYSLCMDRNLMKDFLAARDKMPFLRSYVSYSEEERPHLIITNPSILATFIGFLKFQSRKSNKTGEVFFRGQTKNYKQIVPSILRGDDLDHINLLSIAYDELKTYTRSLFNASRFKEETIDNLFQQYGIRSKTLDLVDNIFVALWFATNTLERKGLLFNFCESEEQFGWIYFMLVDGPQPQNDQNQNDPGFNGYCDLRKFHSSLSARLHCQHGITYFRNNDGEWNFKNRCFDNLVIAAVKFPNTKEFKLNVGLITKEFLFPEKKIDNTYQLLSKTKFAELQTKIENQFGLDKNSLGEIWQFDFH